MADPHSTQAFSDKEAVPPPTGSIEHSYGKEVDGRGIETVEQQRVPTQHSRRAFWTRRRLIIAAAVAICVVGAIVGGAVEGTIGKHHGSSKPSTASSTSPPSSSMTGLASPQLAVLRYPTPISTFGQGTIDVYLQSNDGSVYAKQFINGSWQPSPTDFWRLGGISTTNIAAVSRSQGTTDLFVRGSDYYIYNQSRPNSEPSSWSQSCQCWDNTNGIAISGPEAVCLTSTQLDIFECRFDGILYDMSWRTPSSSSLLLKPGNWSWLGANDGLTHDWFNYTPTVVSWGESRYDFFGVRSFDRGLYHRAFNEDHGWDVDFERLGGYCTSRPAAVSIASGRLDVLVRGGDARLWHISYDDTTSQGWSGFQLVGNISLLGEPHAVKWSEDGIAAFVCGEADSAIWYAQYDRENWTAWLSLGGNFGGPPKAISKAPGQLDVFVVGRGGELMWRSWDEHRGSWEPPNEWRIWELLDRSTLQLQLEQRRVDAEQNLPRSKLAFYLVRCLPGDRFYD